MESRDEGLQNTRYLDLSDFHRSLQSRISLIVYNGSWTDRCRETLTVLNVHTPWSVTSACIPSENLTRFEPGFSYTRSQDFSTELFRSVLQTDIWKKNVT